MMKRDIRDLFKEEDDTGKILPKEHREEFYQKLKASRQQQGQRFKFGYVLKVAALLILFVAVTFIVIKNSEGVSNTIVEHSTIETQIEAIEKDYLASIDKEWNNFIQVANDDRLIDRYERKLEELDKHYKEITLEFKTDPNNITVLEALVDNLKTRLNLLKDIQKHINLLNQTNEHHENSI